MELFARPRPAAGTGRVALRLGPLELEIDGLDGDLAAALHERYRPYSTREAQSADALRVRVAVEDREYFVRPVPPELSRMHVVCDGDRVRYVSYRVAGWFDVAGARGELLLARGDYDTPERALENFVRAAVAWRAVGRGGALVHAASAVRDGRAYLFYGESGAGKSTLSACSRRGRIVSDDLTLVLPGDGAGGGLDVIGSPFRGTYEGGAPVLGQFPLRAGFRLIQAPSAEVRPVARVRALAELVGNLPFVAEAFAARPDLFAGVERAFSQVPLAHLAFRKDDSFWDAIDAAGY
jgi:hypothetical protein